MSHLHTNLLRVLKKQASLALIYSSYCTFCIIFALNKFRAIVFCRSVFCFYALKIWLLAANFPVIDLTTKYSRKVSKLCF